jgi:hypothetical protein
VEQYIQAKILKADLEAIDAEFSTNGIAGMQNAIFLKHSFICLANVFDFELTVRRIYQTNPELNVKYSEFKKECEFIKYLRNKFSGHLKQELVEKSLEWNPGMLLFLERMDEPMVAYFVNQLILETAINTYTDVNGNHKVFDTETDLNYPPDIERFLILLTNVVRGSVEYLGAYIEVRSSELLSEINESSSLETQLNLARVASQTEFKFIAK